MRAFEQEDCLYYLEQFTEAQPKELVCSCQHLSPDRAYDEAKALLIQHFGDEIKITTALM